MLLVESEIQATSSVAKLVAVGMGLSTWEESKFEKESRRRGMVCHHCHTHPMCRSVDWCHLQNQFLSPLCVLSITEYLRKKIMNYNIAM